MAECPRRRCGRSDDARPAGDCVLVKGSRAVGLEAVAAALAESQPGTRRWSASSPPASSRSSSRSSSARSSSPSCASELGQHIREEAAGAPHRQAGHADAGRARHPRRRLRRVPRALELHDERAARLLRHARLRRDRLSRRLHQAHAPALARPERPLEAAPARGDRHRRRVRQRTPRALDERLPSRRATGSSAVVGLVRARLPR